MKGKIHIILVNKPGRSSCEDADCDFSEERISFTHAEFKDLIDKIAEGTDIQMMCQITTQL